MRKCAAIVCAVLMTVSACACGKDKPIPSTMTSIPRVSTTTTTTPTKDYTEEPGKAPLHLTFATSFSDGVAFVRYLDGDGVEHSAAINTAGDVLFEMPEDMPFDGVGYKDGIRVVGNVIYDKTGAVIASPEMSGYDALLTGSCGGYVVAKKTEPVILPAPETTIPTTPTTTAPSTEDAEITDPSATDTTAVTTGTTGATETTDATDGTDTTDTTDTTGTTTVAPIDPPIVNAEIVSVGVLNKQGEWVYPLSVDHPIAQVMAAAVQPTVMLDYITTDVLQVRADVAGVAQYYHFSDNTLTANYGQYASFATTETEAAGVYRMLADGTKELVVEGVFGDYFFSDIFIGREVIPATVFGEPESLGVTKMYDYEGNELADLSAYTLGGLAGRPFGYYAGEHLVLPITDEFGSRLLLVLDKKGQPVYESPIALGMRDTLFQPDVSGFVVESYTAEGDAHYRHYNYDGNITDYADVTAFAGFFDGLATVTLRGDTAQYYYINYRGEIVLR